LYRFGSGKYFRLRHSRKVETPIPSRAAACAKEIASGGPGGVGGGCSPLLRRLLASIPLPIFGIFEVPLLSLFREMLLVWLIPILLITRFLFLEDQHFLPPYMPVLVSGCRALALSTGLDEFSIDTEKTSTRGFSPMFIGKKIKSEKKVVAPSVLHCSTFRAAYPWSPLFCAIFNWSLSAKN